MAIQEQQQSTDKDPPMLWRPITDRIVNSLWVEMSKKKPVRLQDIYHVIESDFVTEYHPFRYYLEHLPPWDGRNHILAMSVSVHVKGGVDEQMRFYEYLRKWLVAMVAGWIDDEVVNHVILTLIGDQGIYKTTFFRYLLPVELQPYYHENSTNSFSNKDEQIALTENCLVEIEEVDAFRDQHNADLKSLSTKVRLKIRRPYDRFMVNKHRLASLCATGNQERFLVDETGNRRWLCFRVSSIDDPRQWALDYTQLYAQLRDEYLDGFPYFFNKKEEEQMKQQNEYFRIVSDEEQLIMERFRKPLPTDIDIKTYSAATIAQRISYGRMPISSRKVSLAMKNLGYTPLHSRSGNIYRIYELKPDEQQSNMLAMQDAYMVDNQHGAMEQGLPF